MKRQIDIKDTYHYLYDINLEDITYVKPEDTSIFCFTMSSENGKKIILQVIEFMLEEMERNFGYNFT